jgi:hypothetical protein
MSVTEIPDHGYLFTGHDTPRADVLEQVRHLLVAAGTHPLDAEAQTVDRVGLVTRTWWGGDDRGFVQEHHEGATPVTIVNIAPTEATP